MPAPTQDLPWFFRFHDLMPFRIREILLVSSPYDAFTLEEDGRLTERLFQEYSELDRRNAPRITHAATGSRATALLEARRFDLVISLTRLEDLDVPALARRVKAIDPRIPFVVLGTGDGEIQRLRPRLDPAHVDGVFVWSGNARILLAILELVEDRQNVAHDTALADIGVILVAEDSVRRYSSFLTLLYQELMGQAASLVSEGVNEVHKATRMRARPKILLAETYEAAEQIVARYQEHLFAVLTDARFPRGGVEDARAGFRLIDLAWARDPDLPVFLQSAEHDVVEQALRMGIPAAHKANPRLGHIVRRFVGESLGFGPFVFRLADRTEVARARDLYEMEDVLQTVPAESISYHAEHNHFSRWLAARTLFPMARKVRPTRLDDVGGAEGVREQCLTLLREARQAEQQGLITNFSEHHVRSDSPFIRLRKGSIGGKARGLAFINSMLARNVHLHRFAGLTLRTPKTVAVGTDEFDHFLDDNGLHEIVAERSVAGQDVLPDFLQGILSHGLRRDLEIAARTLQGPLAVRSSSLLEDAQHQPFAGIYATYLLPNAHLSPNVRFEQLCRAVKAVYASTFSANARAYVEHTPYSLDDEKMGVVIQELVGRPHGRRFYPTVSGVALSYNFYPIGGQRPEDGLALLGLGLGQNVVAGGSALAVCPRSPNRFPQFQSAADRFRYGQRGFWALDMSALTVDFASGPQSNLQFYPLAAAEEDGTLAPVGSVYAPEDDVIRHDLRRPGPRVVTFANLLEYGPLPLAEALDALLEEARHGLGSAAEIEFSLDLEPGGRAGTLYLLQIRPQAEKVTKEPLDLDRLDPDRLLARSLSTLGHGVYPDLYDVVHVRARTLDPERSRRLAARVGALDRQLRAEGRPYVLVGPGRWGSSDPTLGIPVEWAQISGVRVLVETDLAERLVEPSQGSHFFHNLASQGTGYLCAHVRSPQPADDFFAADLLDAAPACLADEPDVRHVRFEAPLAAYLDGTTARGVLVRPGRAVRPRRLDSSLGAAAG